MEEFNFAGTRTKGNLKLLTHHHYRIGVFASRTEDSADDTLRLQWAIRKGNEHRCIVGTFHSQAECEILYFALKNGGSAIWFMGCAIPKQLPDFCKNYIKSRRLLIVSCFNSEHHNIYTARYCTHLANMVSEKLVFFNRKTKSIHTYIYNQAVRNGKKTESY